MKITVTSDLHLDFWIKPKDGASKQKKKMHAMIKRLMPIEPSDTIVIAGDIGHYNTQNEMFLRVLTDYFKNVLWVFGNHDLYMVSKNIVKSFDDNSFFRLADMIKRSQSIPNVHYLDGNFIEIDGVKIGGTGLWYDYGYAHHEFGIPMWEGLSHWVMTMNDSNYIRVPNKQGAPDYINFESFCKEEKEKLGAIIEQLDVIVTHVSPNWSRMPIKYRYSESTFWYFDGRELMSRTNKNQIWIHGHTHDKFFYEQEDACTIICNPLGYPGRSINLNSKEMTEFKFLTVDVGAIPSYNEIFKDVT